MLEFYAYVYVYVYIYTSKLLQKRLKARLHRRYLRRFKQRFLRRFLWRNKLIFIIYCLLSCLAGTKHGPFFIHGNGNGLVFVSKCTVVLFFDHLCQSMQ